MLVLTLDPSQYGYDEAATRALYRDLLEETRSLSGVESAAHASSVPLGYNSRSMRVGPWGHVFAPDDQGIRAGYNVVGNEYFATMRIPLLRGRSLRDSDDADSPAVAVINEAMAEDLWPGMDPLGRRFERDIGDGNEAREPVTVVGVVPNGKYMFLFEPTTPFFYVPFSQSYAPLQTLHVRSPMAPDTLSPKLRDIAYRLAPHVPIDSLMTMEDSLRGGNGFLLPIVGATMATALGVLALLLATVGLYSVVSFAADTRRREIGIRMALGADGRDIIRMVLHQGVRVTLIGVGFGMAATLLSSRLLGALLIDTAATDPTVYIAMSLFLVLVASIASLIPARRAATVDPLLGATAGLEPPPPAWRR